MDKIVPERLKLRHLQFAVAIADGGSMAKAGEALSVSQPVITRGVQDLEEILGAPLFDRAARGVVPTSIGETFVAHARAVMAQIRNATDEVSAMQTGRVGSVRVGTHLAGSTMLLPQAILRLKQLNEHLVVQVMEATPDRLRHALLVGEIDLVVGRLSPTLPEDRLVNEALYHEPVGLVTRQGHPAQRDRAHNLANLLQYPWILPVAQTALRRELEELFVNEGVDLPANRIDCNSMPTTRALVLNSDTIAVVPLLVAHQEERLVILPTTLEPLRRPVGITSHSARWESPNVRAMRTCLRLAGQEIGSWLSLRTGLPDVGPGDLLPSSTGADSGAGLHTALRR